MRQFIALHKGKWGEKGWGQCAEGRGRAGMEAGQPLTRIPPYGEKLALHTGRVW